jgi:antitoxin (DNA-binding transcriptional repressor) of toxin-antitoxin stability system
MSSLTIQEAQAKRSELIHNLKPGDEVVIRDND